MHPSINELRYAGRRFVDAISILSEENVSDENRNTAENYLNEAFMFCMRAEHDCVDAVVTYAHLLIEKNSEKYGLFLLMQACPSLEKYRLIKPRIDKLILSSREERSLRDDLYQEIISDYIENMIDIICSLELAEPLIKKQKEYMRNEKIINYTIGAVGVIGAALTAISML